MSMKIKILGSGAAPGVPSICKGWGVCDPNNPKNFRTRCSALISSDTTDILIDTSPEFRLQAINNKIEKIDAVIFTHAHNDHTAGIDDIRGFNRLTQKPIETYGTKPFLNDMKRRFPYIFNDNISKYHPSVLMNEIEPYKEFNIGNVNILPIRLHDHMCDLIGYVFNNKIAYLTDFLNIEQQDLDRLKNIDLLVIGCLSQKGSDFQAPFNKVLEYIDYINPKQAIITHMSSGIDYEWVKDNTQSFTTPAYDGLEIEVK